MLSSFEAQKILREVQIATKFSHVNIVHYVTCWIDSEILQSQPKITEVETPSPICETEKIWFENEQPKISYSKVDDSWGGEDEWEVSDSEDDAVVIISEKSKEKIGSPKGFSSSSNGKISAKVRQQFIDENSRQLAIIEKSSHSLDATRTGW